MKEVALGLEKAAGLIVIAKSALFKCVEETPTIDPIGQPTIMAGSDHYFHSIMSFVRTSDRLSLLFKIAKNKTIFK